MPAFGGASWSGSATGGAVVQFSFAASFIKDGITHLLSDSCAFYVIRGHNSAAAARAMADAINRSFGPKVVAGVDDDHVSIFFDYATLDDCKISVTPLAPSGTRTEYPFKIIGVTAPVVGRMVERTDGIL